MNILRWLSTSTLLAYGLTAAAAPPEPPLTRPVDLTRTGVVWEETVRFPWVWTSDYDLQIAAQYADQSRFYEEMRERRWSVRQPIALWSVLGLRNHKESSNLDMPGMPLLVPGAAIQLRVTITPSKGSKSPRGYSRPVFVGKSFPAWKYRTLAGDQPVDELLDLSPFGTEGSELMPRQYKDLLYLQRLERGGVYRIRVENMSAISPPPGVLISIDLNPSRTKY